LSHEFTFNHLKERINELKSNPDFLPDSETIDIIYWLANSNYVIKFHTEYGISERVIFPTSTNESSGIEDARFVQFFDEDGESTYYATYTAYNGFSILPQMIKTKDFITFKIITLNGKAIQNKGMALFPRKINGKYAMLSRQDGENNHIMYSDSLYFWQESKIIQEPEMPWEFVQIGNCGSPVETEEGWLVLTHGVGPMRQYCIGAILLDLENPEKIIGRLNEPLITPREGEREGYVPNVVYTCGSLIHNNRLIIPYAMSDIASAIATVSVSELISCMKRA
ncbi:MAG: glycoside hydrolase family 130 protein, partial [Bacteroidetes bacterium]|nr:glycoside hydrolase family 130 protein [Bacteroidota bacterium]